MLDFLKTVLGDAYTDEIDKKISEEIGKGFVARADFNTLKDSKKGLEEQLKTANETISGFKDMDIEGVKAEAEKYRIAAEQAEKDADERIAGRAKDHVQAFGVRVSEMGIYSSRKIEDLCRENLQFIWLLDGQRVPDHCAIAHFCSGKTTQHAIEGNNMPPGPLCNLH